MNVMQCYILLLHDDVFVAMYCIYEEEEEICLLHDDVFTAMYFDDNAVICSVQ